jgi:hypothetical protein
MTHIIEHALGLCIDSKTHINILGILLDPQPFITIFNYIKITWRINQ